MKPGDPVSFLAVPGVLGSVALVAAWIPALCASPCRSQHRLARRAAVAVETLDMQAVSRKLAETSRNPQLFSQGDGVVKDRLHGVNPKSETAS